MSFKNIGVLVGSKEAIAMLREMPRRMRASAKNAQFRRIAKPYLTELKANIQSNVTGQTTGINTSNAVAISQVRTKGGFILGATLKDKNSYKLRFIERGFAGKTRISPKPMFRPVFNKMDAKVNKSLAKDFDDTVRRVLKRHKKKLL